MDTRLEQTLYYQRSHMRATDYKKVTHYYMSLGKVKGKTAFSYHQTPITMFKIKRLTIPYILKEAEQLELIYCW